MFEAGEHIYLPGSAGEPTALVDTILATPGARITTSFVPGVNRIDADKLGEATQISGLFMHADVARKRPGTFRHLPITYGGFLKRLAEGPGFDSVVVQCSMPDREGYCSLGPAAEFSALALGRGRRKIAVLNAQTPFIPSAPKFKVGDFDRVVEADTPLPVYGSGAADPVSARIAGHIAGFVADGAALQFGLGKVPNALADALLGRRNLRLHSGMLSDGTIALAAAGALDPDWRHTTTCLLGSENLYRWAAERSDIHVTGCDGTHHPAVLAGIAGLVAINSALEVDLFGQCNLEIADGTAISGPGGAPDFARAGSLSPGGCSIIALPATFARGTGSRIHARLPQQSIVSLSRIEVDIVITEEGAADLRGKTVAERGAALIAVAAPAFREELAAAWRGMMGG